MFKKKILKNRQFLGILIIYTLSHIFLCTNNFYINFLNPLFWLIFLYIFNYHEFETLKKREVHTTLIISIIFLIIHFCSGFVFGFNKNPCNFSLINIFKSIGHIYGIEILRYKLIKYNHNFKFRTLITIFIILSEINFRAFFLSHNIIFLHYFISKIVPIIVQNILFTYLSLNSYYKIPIIIRVFNEIPLLILPYISYSNWFMDGSFAIIKVLIIYYLFNKKTIKNFSKTNILYFLTIIISILIVLFMLGFFNYHPIAILSNSMSPTFNKGDVVIYKSKENIMPGDIIVFEYGDHVIVHRVVGVNQYYVTKGDANNTVDYMKINQKNIKGVYQFSLKYLGYPSIWLNDLFSKEN